MLSLESFSEHNRDKKIGNSLYRICRVKGFSGNWHIAEFFNDRLTWVGNKAYYSDSLEFVIEKFNQITKEKEIVSLRFKNL